MNRRILLLAATLPVIALPARAQTLRERFAGTGAGATVFVEFATISDNFEIEASRILLARSTHAGIRPFAERMIMQHGQMANELRSLPEATTRQPAQFDQRQADRLAVLRQQQDPDMLNRWYVEQQIQSHEEMLEAYRIYAENGDVPALRSHAQRYAPLIEENLKAARALQAPREG